MSIEIGTTWRHLVRNSIMRIDRIEGTTVHFTCIISRHGTKMVKHQRSSFCHIARFERVFVQCEAKQPEHQP